MSSTRPCKATNGSRSVLLAQRSVIPVKVSIAEVRTARATLPWTGNGNTWRLWWRGSLEDRVHRRSCIAALGEFDCSRFDQGGAGTPRTLLLTCHLRCCASRRVGTQSRRDRRLSSPPKLHNIPSNTPYVRTRAIPAKSTRRNRLFRGTRTDFMPKRHQVVWFWPLGCAAGGGAHPSFFVPEILIIRPRRRNCFADRWTAVPRF